MKSRYKIFDQQAVHFITSSIVDWLPIFKDDQYREIIINALEYRRKNKHLTLYAYVIMDDHIHATLSSENITKLMKEFKSFTARKIVNQLRSDGNKNLLGQLKACKKEYKIDSEFQVWQEGFHPKLIQSLEMFNQKVNYIHMNPVRKGLAERPEEWKYSSASNYLTGKGIIEVDFII